MVFLAQAFLPVLLGSSRCASVPPSTQKSSVQDAVSAPSRILYSWVRFSRADLFTLTEAKGRGGLLLDIDAGARTGHSFETSGEGA